MQLVVFAKIDIAKMRKNVELGDRVWVPSENDAWVNSKNYHKHNRQINDYCFTDMWYCQQNFKY